MDPIFSGAKYFRTQFFSGSEYFQDQNISWPKFFWTKIFVSLAKLWARYSSVPACYFYFVVKLQPDLELSWMNLRVGVDFVTGTRRRGRVTVVVSRSCLEGVFKVSWRCLECIWKVSGMSLLKPKIFYDFQSFGN